MQLRPYIVIPNLIEQPTWGGDYIVEFKRMSQPELRGKKIGQSYELYEFSNLSSLDSTVGSASFELGNPTNPQESTQHLVSHDRSVAITDLIETDPEGVLGTRYTKVFGPRVKTLIKFTQALGNSYQIHVQKPSGTWLPKPESWYYFEPGLITLGTKTGVNWSAYESVCRQINETAKTLSERARTGAITVEEAQRLLADFVSAHDPQEFVNVLRIEKNQGVDLSDCGLHHSWEEAEDLPLGNVLYEVQESVYDDVSTIRSFDKGKMKADGSIRPVQIDEYFAYIDRSQDANDPANHMIKTKTDSAEQKQLTFSNSRYVMDQLIVKNPYQEILTDTFHHIFVKDGAIELSTTDGELILTKGYSAFIPAKVGTYQLKTTTEAGEATILRTYL